MGNELEIAFFSAVAEAVFSYALEHIRIADRLREVLKRDPSRLAYQKALARTYTAFARQYPELTDSLFDQSFLTHEAMPELGKLLTRHEHPDPAHLAVLWATSFVPKTDAGQTSIAKWSKDARIVTASAQFLHWLESELKAEPIFQPLFDSRALESLPAIEVNLDKLSKDLQQALNNAAHYQQTVVNRSGGIDFMAHEVNIGGDVVGRDKIVSNVYHNYFYGGFETLDDLYVRPDEIFLDVQLQDFIGRDWLVAKVDAFLNDPKRKSGVFLLVGEAGVGKTSFLAHLVAERRYLHLFAKQVPGEVNLSTALKSLGAQIVARYAIDPYKDRDSLPDSAASPNFLFNLLRLAANKLIAGEQIVIVCDALDEAGTAPNRNVFGLPSALPEGVYFILSQRPVPIRLTIKSDLVTEKIEAAGADNLHDIEQYLKIVALRSEISEQLHAHHYSEASFVRTLAEKSRGVWMYLYYVVNEIISGKRALLDLARLPSGLTGYYTAYWGDWRTGHNGRGEGRAKWNALYAPLLTTLAAAHEPITSDTLIAWSRVEANTYDIEDLMRWTWPAFITARSEDATDLHYRLYHASLRDFLTGKVDPAGLDVESEALVGELMRRTRDAHTRIVEYYYRKCNGDWVKLVEDDYARVHLCQHLAESGNRESLETLFQMVAMSNTWAHAKSERELSYAGYFIDLDLARQYVDGKAYWNVGRQVRCALIGSTVHSLTENISSELLTLLVETRLWSPARALAHVSQISMPHQRVEALKRLAPCIPHDLKFEALEVANAFAEERDRASALSGIAASLPNELKAKALNAVREITGEKERLDALHGILVVLPDDLKAEALLIARDFVDIDFRAQALTAVVLRSSEVLLRPDWLHEALMSARAARRSDIRAGCLAALAPKIQEPDRAEVVGEALAATRDIEDGLWHALTLISLIPLLPEELEAAVAREVILAARSVDNPINRAWALTDFISIAPDSLEIEATREALDAIRAIGPSAMQTHELVNLVPKLSDVMQLGALAMITSIPDLTSRADALAQIMPKLGSVAQAQARTVARAILDQTRGANPPEPKIPQFGMAQEQQTNDRQRRAVITAKIASVFSDDASVNLVQESLALARAIDNNYTLAETFIKMIPVFSDTVKTCVAQEALTAVCNVEHKWLRCHMLTELAPYLPLSLKTLAARDAVEAASVIGDEQGFSHLLLEVPDALPENLKAEALSAASSIENEGDRAEALVKLAPALPVVFQDAAVVVLCAIQDQHVRADALAEVIPAVSASIQSKAWELLASMEPQHWTCTLQKLMAKVTNSLASEILSKVVAIDDEAWRATTLTDLLPELPASLKAAAFTALCAVKSVAHRIDALVKISPFLSDSQQAVAVSAILDTGSYSGYGLKRFVPTLPGKVQSDVLVALRSISDKGECVYILGELVPVILPELRAEAVRMILDAVHDVDESAVRARLLLTSFKGYQFPDEFKPQVANEILNSARSVGDSVIRADILSDLISQVPNELMVEPVNELLSSVRSISEAEARAKVLLDILPDIPETLRAEIGTDAVKAAFALDNDLERAVALAKLADMVPEEVNGRATKQTFIAARDIEDVETRVTVLFHLLSIVPAELKSEAVLGALDAIHAVADDKIRAAVLSNLPNHLPDVIIADVYGVAKGIHDEKLRAETLVEMLSLLPDALQIEVIITACTFTEDSARWRVLSGIVPKLSDSAKTEILSAIEATADEGVQAEVLIELMDVASYALQVGILTAVCAFKDSWCQTNTLSRVLPKMSGAATSETLAVLKTICDERARADALTDFFAIAPVTLHGEILSVVIGIGDEGYRANALTKLAPDVSDDLKKDIFTAVCAIESESTRASALADLVSIAPDDLKRAALLAVRSLNDEYTRTNTLIKLTQWLTDDLRAVLAEDLLRKLRSIGNMPLIRPEQDYGRIIVAWRDIGYINFSDQIWLELLSKLQFISRGAVLEILASLMPVIEHFGGSAAATDTLIAARDVTHWWP